MILHFMKPNEKPAISILHIKSITDFLIIMEIGKPIHPDIMCIRQEDQPGGRLMYLPLYRANFFCVIHFIDSNILSLVQDKVRDYKKRFSI